MKNEKLLTSLLEAAKTQWQSIFYTSKHCLLMVTYSLLMLLENGQKVSK
jgi:hypothetical protein